MANNTQQAVQVVVDANVVLNFVLPSLPYHEHAQSIVSHWSQNSVRLLAPPLFESEADSAIRRYIYHRYLTREAGQAAQRSLEALTVDIVHDPNVRRRAQQIAEEFNQERVYDATYAALADVMGCEFWTADRKFYEAVKSGLSYVKFLGDVPPA